jgi:hypothetical protein
MLPPHDWFTVVQGGAISQHLIMVAVALINDADVTFHEASTNVMVVINLKNGFHWAFCHPQRSGCSMTPVLDLHSVRCFESAALSEAYRVSSHRMNSFVIFVVMDTHIHNTHCPESALPGPPSGQGEVSQVPSEEYAQQGSDLRDQDGWLGRGRHLLLM